MRIEIAALAVVDGAVGQHDELRALADALLGLLLDPLDRAAQRLGLEQRDVDADRPPSELLPEVFEEVGLLLARDLAVGGVRKRREVVMAAEDDRERRLDGRGVGGGVVERRPAPEDRACREVLDLPLAVDRRVRHHGDRLLEVVGEVLALRGERGERAVVAERADGLRAVRGHLLAELHVVALPAESREDVLGDLHRLRGTRRGVAGDLASLERAAGLEGAVVRGNDGAAGPLEPAPRNLALELPVLPEPRVAAAAVDRDHELLPRPERLGLGDHLLAADDAGLGAEDEVAAGLDLPQRAEAKGVGGEDALVAVARNQRHRPLRGTCRRGGARPGASALRRRSGGPPSPSPRPVRGPPRG